jgi:cysteinyl-tRNA synthetase
MGHARSYVAFDSLRRYLAFLGYRVTYVQNFTDIEEVIIRRAAEVDKPPLTYAQFFIDAFLEDMRALNVLPAGVHPKVTDHIPEIVATVGKLLETGYAYEVGGEVYFRTRKATRSFGLLSHSKVEDIVVGELPPGSPKEHALDFALWKRSKEGEPSWPSPWGAGRPGWHVECFAMASKYLGAPIDIHGGGVDLKFPHHESEAMICEGTTGGDWCDTWLHNGFVLIEREKMSKSLGNFVTIREVLRDYPGEVIRLCLLKSHYREDVEYDVDCFRRTQEEYLAMLEQIRRARRAKGPGTGGKVAALVLRTRQAFLAAMDDDLHTDDAILRLQQMTEGLGHLESTSAAEGRSIVNTFEDLGNLLGLTIGGPPSSRRDAGRPRGRPGRTTAGPRRAGHRSR